MTCARHSCPVPSDSTGSSSLPEKGQDDRETFWVKLGQCVDTRSGSVDTRELPRTPSGLFWDSVSTLDQLVSTLVALPEQNIWSGSVDTRDSFQKTFWPIWESVSTLEQVVSTLDQLPETFWVKLGQCVDTRSVSVDTRELPRTPSGLFWDSVSTLDQLVSTLVALPEQNIWSGVTRKHVSCCDSLSLLITL
ncbi:hypothetical protein Taro_043808 [Colocasia esculenta]|uniref:Uncharacterized protein n=1 Tax=Colocasia esculenta TaxID=4460 RepID=A0A843WSZ8_COLES|nr:hypothetical protein [Colocasia esculenta]